MPLRATSVVSAELQRGEAFDTIILPHDGRYRRRITMRTEGDLVFLLDLPQATHLQHGDGLLLEDGRVIGVVAAEEPVVEITAADAHHLARIAWHVGNRHVPAEILGDRIRIEPDPIIEEMARGLGGTVTRAEARFAPEGGAYEQAAAHAHGHAHHGHKHDDHAHQHHGHEHHVYEHHGHADHDHKHDHEHHHDNDHDHTHGHHHPGKPA